VIFRKSPQAGRVPPNSPGFLFSSEQRADGGRNSPPSAIDFTLDWKCLPMTQRSRKSGVGGVAACLRLSCAAMNLSLTLILPVILASSSAYAQTAKPADATQQAASQDGKYTDADGNPTFHKSPDGKWDWQTYSGYIRYNANCIVCHGPDGSGSTYAPALADSLKTMDYQKFTETVVQ
jgi:mono/diheme cytochrome c family protein